MCCDSHNMKAVIVLNKHVPYVCKYTVSCLALNHAVHTCIWGKTAKIKAWFNVNENEWRN